MTAKELFKRGNEFFFFDDPAETAALCRKKYPEDCAHIIRVADEVCRNYFLFDLEHDLERTWEPVIFPEDAPIDWEYRPGNDPEFTFQFNRHRFLICLGQAYWLTGNSAYETHFFRLLMDFIDHIRRTPKTEQTTWRILEAGIRGENWVKALRYFKDSPIMTDERAEKIWKCLREHGEYIIEMDSPYRYISNWGVMENHGLFEIGIQMPDPETRERFTSIALERLAREARMQIFDDGVQWEQSPMYHNEVFHCFEDVLLLAGRNGIKAPDELWEAMRKMACANLAWIRPDHRQIIMGDSDDMDLRDYMSIAAYLLKDPVLKSGGFSELDFESLWDIGVKGAREYALLESRRPDFISAALNDSGNYYIRSSWEEDADLLHFHCGTMGAGHGHSDKLHVDLILAGEDVLTDSGRYTYVVDRGRFEFKNPDAHNTVIVDGEFFTQCKDAWECSKLTQPVKQLFKEKDGYAFIQGGNLGYMHKGVFVNRQIVSLGDGLYVIADELYGAGDHEMEQYWNFSERGRAAYENGRAVFTGERVKAELLFVSPGCQAVLGEGKISRHYNRYETRTRLGVKRAGKGFQSMITVIGGGKKEEERRIRASLIPVRSALKGITYPASMAEAVKVETAKQEYVVILCHQEVNSPTDLTEADGCMGYGNVIVFDKRKSCTGGTVLCY